MSTSAREFVDFWIGCTEQSERHFLPRKSSQGAADLADRCLKAAKGLSISEEDIRSELGDLVGYIEKNLPSNSPAAR